MNFRRLGRSLSDLTAQTRTTRPPAPVPSPPPVPPSFARLSTARVICVTSGKGGTGKSVVTSNLATQLVLQGRRVLAVDMDLGLANLHLLLGVTPRRSLYNSLLSNLTFREVSERTHNGVVLVAGPSGVAELADLSAKDLGHLIGETGRYGSEFDIVLVDTAAGIARMTMAFLNAAREILIVTTPDITAMTDAYATMKTTLKHNPEAVLSVVVNRAPTSRQAWEVFQTLDGIASRFMGRRLKYLGYLPEDDAVRRSIAIKTPAVQAEPASSVAMRVREIASALLSADSPAHVQPRVFNPQVRQGTSS